MIKNLLFTILSVFLFCYFPCAAQSKGGVLVFSKTVKYRHQSIAAGKQMFLELGKKYHFPVDTTEDAHAFTAENLKKYKAVVFLNTTGDVLNDSQQVIFQDFIHHGGGFLGIHAATDTEYDWPWYNHLVGAYFDSHPTPQVATYHVLDKKFPAMRGLPDSIVRKEEIYNFKSVQKEDLHFLMSVDEKSYKGGNMGAFHPAAWYHEFEGGRAFYIAWGHFDVTYQEPQFQDIIIKALDWVRKK